MSPMTKVLDVLAYRKRQDLAALLSNSWYEIQPSTTYGSRWNSILSTAEIYSPISKNEKLLELSKADIQEILRAFHVIYPVKEGEIEINHLEFFVDPEAPIPVPPAELRKLVKADYDYIKDQLSKCNEKMITGDYEGAITNSRTLLETVLKYILDEAKVEYLPDDDLQRLYKRTATVLGMNPAEHEERAFKEILSGCISVVHGLSSVRNAMGDAHGKSRKTQYKPLERHAHLAVGLAQTISDYLLSSYLENIKRGT